MPTTRPYPISDTENLRALRSDGPMPLKDLPQSGGMSPEAKKYVFKLKMHAVYAGSKKKRGDPEPFAYLIGDERRAVRRFIDENEDFVASCMEDASNPIKSRVDDFMWAIFCEEWYWDRMDEVPADVYGASGGEIHTEVYRDEAGRITAPRKVSGQPRSKSITVPPAVVDELELEGGERLHVRYTDRGLLFSREEPDSYEKKLTLTETRHSEGHSSYSVTVPAGYEELEYGDVGTIIGLGTGQFVVSP